MTSLIDVIFLLLLFFMLSSTFSRFSEVELAATGRGSGTSTEITPAFLQLGASSLHLTGQDVALTALADLLENVLAGLGEAPARVLVSLRGDVSAQRRTDLLVALRRIGRGSGRVLGAS